jgi:hypothetical protein
MYAQECLKRTAECARLAEATNDPGLRKYLTKLALSWMQSTTMAERNERLPADGPQRRRLKTVHDLFSSNVRERPPPFAWRKRLNASSRVSSEPAQ